MVVSFLSDNIQKEISFLSHAISTRSTLPILSNFLLVAKNGELMISATDLEIGIQVKIPAKVEKEGITAVVAKNFSDLLISLENQKITIEATDSALSLRGEKIKATFQTMSAEDFPKLYDQKGEKHFSLSPKEVKDVFSRIVFAAAADASRPALSGVLLDSQKEGALFVATDSYRLSYQKTSLKSSKGLERPIIIPSRFIREIFSLKETGQNLDIYISKESNQIIIEQDNTVLVGRLIDSEYPNYSKIIPVDFNTKAEVLRQELLSAIKICAIFARETANIVKLSILKDKVIVSANSPQVGEDSVEVEAKVSGEENEIAFNAKYLIDVLSALSEEKVTFEMNASLNPGVFKIPGDNSFLHLIMPIRVQE